MVLEKRIFGIKKKKGSLDGTWIQRFPVVKKKDDLDFSKRRREHINEKRETEHPEQSSKKTRYSRESVLDEESEQDIDGELDGEQVADESTAATKSAFRSESIRGQPRGERAYLETVADSRDLRKKKMVRDYASKERRKEKEASEESKTAKREAAPAERASVCGLAEVRS